MKIEVQLNNAVLKGEDVKETHVTNVIEKFFGMLIGSFNGIEVGNQEMIKSSIPQKNETIESAAAELKRVNGILNVDEVSETKEHIAHGLIAKIANEAVLPLSKKTITPINPPKILPKVNGDRTLQVPISELVNVNKTPEHWETGIKQTENGPRYQCKYWCDCGNEGKRFIKKVTKHVYCHSCNAKIIVEPATPGINENGLPERDGFGNFFIAREVKLEVGE